MVAAKRRPLARYKNNDFSNIGLPPLFDQGALRSEWRISCSKLIAPLQGQSRLSEVINSKNRDFSRLFYGMVGAYSDGEAIQDGSRQATSPTPQTLSQSTHS